MAKIDTTKIEGYESMSAEQKLAVLEGYEFDTSGMVSKATLDKATGEAAEWKRKYNSTLSEAEQARIAAEDANKATLARLAELERKDKISTTKDKYLSSGFKPELAQATAEAFVDGKMDVVLANITKHATDVANAAKDEALHGTPTPPASGNPNPGAINYDAEKEKALAAGDFAKAAYFERLKAEQK
jgi:hypothetical protein